jgi:hypothetical protein
MTMQLRTVPPVPGRSPLPWWRLATACGNARRQLHWPISRTRRELDALHAEVRQLEYLQQSLLRATELLLEETGISPESLSGDGAATPK